MLSQPDCLLQFPAVSLTAGNLAVPGGPALHLKLLFGGVPIALSIGPHHKANQ